MARLRLSLNAIVFLLFLVSPAVFGDTLPADEQPLNGSSSYVLKSSVIGAAGSPAANSGKQCNGTLGQPHPVGICTSTNHIMSAGFWRSYRVLVSVLDRLVPGIFENALFQNFPNPFNPSTTIRFTVAAESPVELLIFNVQGQKVRTLIEDSRTAGSYRVVWDGRNDRGKLVATGVYFYRLKIGPYLSVKKMLLIK